MVLFARGWDLLSHLLSFPFSSMVYSWGTKAVCMQDWCFFTWSVDDPTCMYQLWVGFITPHTDTQVRCPSPGMRAVPLKLVQRGWCFLSISLRKPFPCPTFCGMCGTTRLKELNMFSSENKHLHHKETIVSMATMDKGALRGLTRGTVEGGAGTSADLTSHLKTPPDVQKDTVGNHNIIWTHSSFGENYMKFNGNRNEYSLPNMRLCQIFYRFFFVVS